MATLAEATSTLDRLWAELDKRQRDIDTYDKAYRGEFKLHYASEDFQEFFGKRYEKFSDNWCGIVADAPHERLEITGIRLRDEQAGDDDLWRVWQDSDSDAYSDLAFLDAIISKRAFALVWGDDPTRITWEHPSQAIVGYDPETRDRIAGLKAWSDDTHDFATLYLPDEVWKFQRNRGVTFGRTDSGLYVTGASMFGGGWEPRQPSSDDTWPLPNPFGRVPLVEFANRPRLKGEPMSDIAGTLAMQHAINLLWAQLFTASDYASFAQRVVIGAERPTIPVLDEDGQVVGEKPMDLKKFAVDRVEWIEDPQAKIAEWRAVNLEAWTNVIDIGVGHVAAQTRTPAHYLLIGGTIANVPEGALKALETGLVKRTGEKTQHFGRSARDVFELVALAQDDRAKAAAVRGGKVLWKDWENRSEQQRTDALQKKKAMGYPLRYILELDGLPPLEIERVMEMQRDELNDVLSADVLREAVGGDTTPVGE